MKICITGASGFVGRNLSSYLKDRNFELQMTSLRQQLPHDLLYKVTAVVHLAGKAHDLKNVSDEDEYFAVNFELTKKLFDVFVKSDADTFIFMSSVKAVRDTVEGLLDEADLPNPATAYGKSKLAAEKYLLANAPIGKKVVILRPCMIHGPGNKGNLNLLYKLVKKGIPYPLAAFENRRSFLSMENLCFAINEILQRTDVPGGVYNVSDDVPLATNAVIGIISQEIGKKPFLLSLNKNLVRLIAKIGDIFHLPLTTERLKKMTENYLVSNQKLLAALQRKLPVSSDEGLRTTIQSFLDVK